MLAVPSFRTFYIGYVTSLLGSSMSAIAIIWAVLDSTHSATDLGLVMTTGVVAQVALMLLAGAAADRLGRRRVMLAADVLRCAAQGALAVSVLTMRPPLWVFIVLAGLVGAGQAFFSPALQALTVEIAPAGQLGNANALFGLANSVTRIGGPPLAGVLIAVTGRPGLVIAADAASYAASVLALSMIRVPGNRIAGGAAGPGRGVERQRLSRDIAEGWAEFRARRWLCIVTGHWALFNLITWAPWMLLGPAAAHQYLGGAAVWGAIMAAQGAGAVLAGALCLGRRPRRPLVLATVAMFGYAMPDIPMSLHAGAAWVAAAAFSCGAGSAVSMTFGTTAEQQQIPPDMLARLSSLTLFPSYGIGVVGYAIDGPLATAIGASTVFAIGAGFGMLSTALVLLLRPIRGIRWRDP